MKKKFIYALAVVAVLAGCRDREKDEKMLHANKGQPAAMAETGAAEHKYKIDGTRVFFAFDSSHISTDARKSLNDQAKYLKENPELKIMIEGHCDERGTREYNYALGARRADAAKKVMVKDGVSPARIDTMSYGKDNPWVPGTGEEVWRKNRNAKTVVK